MRHFLMSLMGATLIGLASQSASAQEIQIRYSDDVLEEFSETYGDREKEVLEKALRERLMKTIEKDGLNISRIDLLIEDISPNHPTFEQVSNTPGLDQFRSVSIGGAKLIGTSYDLNGEIITESESRLFSSSIRDARHGSTWSDAKRAFTAFSRRLSKDVRAS